MIIPSSLKFRPSSFTAAAGLLLLCPLPCNAIIIELDYTYDSGGFYSVGSEQRGRLQDAAKFFETLLVDNLSAITPTGSMSSNTPESWQITFSNPSTGGYVAIDDVAVAADTIILYVGARSFSGGQLAEASPGGYNTYLYADSPFDNAVNTRGQSGVGTTDFAPWGGFVAVNHDTVWDTSLTGTGSNHHLYSVLLHEIGHVLGIGTAASWSAQISGGAFTGAASVAEFGGNVPLYGSDHWAQGTSSYIYNGGGPQAAAMDPYISSGAVKLFTTLDVAALDDIGWDISSSIPEPTSAACIGLTGILLLRRQRRS